MSTSGTDKPPVCSPSLANDASDKWDAAPTKGTAHPTLPAAAANAGNSWPTRGQAASGTLLHWVFLLLSSFVVVSSSALRVHNGEQVIVPIINQPLPGTCTFRRVTGIPCPGCGLTRSFISLGHGHVLDSWHYNPAGMFFFALVAFQIPYRIYQILRIRRGRPPHCFEYFDSWALILLVVILVAQWVCGLVWRLW